MSIQFYKNHFQNIITLAPHSYFVSSAGAKILSQQKRVDPADSIWRATKRHWIYNPYNISENSGLFATCRSITGIGQMDFFLNDRWTKHAII